MATKAVTPFDEIEINPSLIATDEDAIPLDWSQFAHEAHLTGTPITAEELTGKTFDILRAKKQESSFEEQDHFWFCVVKPVDQDEYFQVVLGGAAVIEILDAYAAKGGNRPLRVTLDFVKGGKYKGYYQFK